LVEGEGECGNGVVEGSEECDCGGPYYCTSTCCDPTTCKLIPPATCSHGPCCHHCQLANTTVACRSADNECDIVDTCDGISPTCRNKHKENGVYCDGGHGICYGGICRSRSKQCEDVWGKNTREAHRQCYKLLNKHGDYYGHCGQTNETSFVACQGDGVYCGVLQCENLANASPILGGGFRRKHTATIRVRGTLYECVAAELKSGRQMVSPGVVYDWTPCASESYCVSGKCTKTEIPKEVEREEVLQQEVDIKCQDENCNPKEGIEVQTTSEPNTGPQLAAGATPGTTKETVHASESVSLQPVIPTPKPSTSMATPLSSTSASPPVDTPQPSREPGSNTNSDQPLANKGKTYKTLFLFFFVGAALGLTSMVKC